MAGAEQGDAELLGGFEDGFDGWKTNGGNELHRVSADSFDTAVTQGGHALGVKIDGDPHPMIQKPNVGGASFDQRPHLGVDVLAATYGDDADVVFSMRYHYDSRGGKGGNRKGKPNVAESDDVRVPQYRSSTLYWDMSDLPDEALASPRRLEITWHPAGRDPSVQPEGRGPASGKEYRGFAVFDNVRLSDVPTDYTANALSALTQRLIREHGSVERAIPEEGDADTEQGRILFADGTTVPYTVERLADEKFVFTLDGEAFKLGGGWA
ncbi:hypothetical protein BRC81_07150 [Halobacteriales archaeon QS_1_68_20]|nr:MAG: hypothetical protein BRC81_07150 [Halobacteriales archaeon QS_1_68_20]